MLIDKESKMLLGLNEFIQGDSPQYNYHLKHIQLVKQYALILNERLQFKLDTRKLSYAALAHDLFKERGLSGENKIWKGYTIPQDNVRYVRMNLPVLEKFGLDDYFNTSIQYHPLAAGIFLYKEMKVHDNEILYPIMMHSCPIMDVYNGLSRQTRNMIDVICLSDKLSSNYLRINMKEVDVRIDLDQAVFGTTGCEMNYSVGLYMARLISGKSEEFQSKLTTQYYYDRMCSVNPLYASIKKLGGNKKWPKRKSSVLKMP